MTSMAFYGFSFRNGTATSLVHFHLPARKGPPEPLATLRPRSATWSYVLILDGV
jgi:hypothetical protein